MKGFAPCMGVAAWLNKPVKKKMGEQMSEKIECPYCGNDDIFLEDVMGLSKTDEWGWDEKEGYCFIKGHEWEHDDATLRCGKCERELPYEIYEQFLESFPINRQKEAV